MDITSTETTTEATQIAGIAPEPTAAVQALLAAKEYIEEVGDCGYEDERRAVFAKIDAALASRIAPAAGAQVAPEGWLRLAKESRHHLTVWLAQDDCECEGAHTCGKPLVEATLCGLNELLAAPAVSERAALASRSEAQPVAYLHQNPEKTRHHVGVTLALPVKENPEYANWSTTPLYAHPAPPAPAPAAPAIAQQADQGASIGDDTEFWRLLVSWASNRGHSHSGDLAAQTDLIAYIDNRTARVALASQAPVEPQCQWPNCLSEQAQQELAAGVHGELYSGDAPAIAQPAQQVAQDREAIDADMLVLLLRESDIINERGAARLLNGDGIPLTINELLQVVRLTTSPP